MKADCWTGRKSVEVQDVPGPSILNSRDVIVKVASTAICGSDLHLVDGCVPTMEKGDILGHEFMGEIVGVGAGISDDKLRVGDRGVVPFPVSCGACASCRAELYSCCENSNPNAGISEKMFGHPICGIYGYSHLTGGQAEYAWGVLADVNAFKIESDLLVLPRAGPVPPPGHAVACATTSTSSAPPRTASHAEPPDTPLRCPARKGEGAGEGPDWFGGTSRGGSRVGAKGGRLAAGAP
ncbi:alcohol dehydrogenase catalytic domain-containing protein [Streptomyces sp. NPDC093094]|uniref:alcohol dehydrogenase catalytic domain-containing protein n=1 Tax=Streptomyces sp. NPDC093094 TaxID=3366026 RepID=UPI00382CA869